MTSRCQLRHGQGETKGERERSGMAAAACVNFGGGLQEVRQNAEDEWNVESRVLHSVRCRRAGGIADDIRVVLALGLHQRIDPKPDGHSELQRRGLKVSAGMHGSTSAKTRGTTAPET